MSSEPVKGRLKRSGKSFMVVLPSKKGEAAHPIPEKAKVFNDKDASDGLEVDVVRDEKNLIIRVSIPDKETVKPTVMRPANNQNARRAQTQRQGANPQQPAHPRNDNAPRPRANQTTDTKDTNKMEKGTASLIGLPFHNPYTFIEFGKSSDQQKPTPRSIDETETEKERFTGIIELKVTTLSPLLVSQSMRNEKNEGHQTYRTLCIGDDVIVQATGVRGFLRYLMTLATGGPLVTVDKEMFLCQGRDKSLGQRTPNNNRPCLARVIVPGNARKPGVIQVGESDLVRATDIELYQRRLPRPEAGKKVEYLWAEYDPQERRLIGISQNKNDRHDWQIKLSGRPVNTRGVKKEGIFRASDRYITLPESFWMAYANRNRHGAHPELRAGDLVWLELNVDISVLRSVEDIESIQWARWGRRGTKLVDMLPEQVKPDYLRNDGKVSTVTDLFGQVPVAKNDSTVTSFAGRIRPDNLVFEDAAKSEKRRIFGPVPLAVLSSPHPGCLPFYRKNADPNTMTQNDSLRGYKVYRTSKHAGCDDSEAPWRFENQGVYNDTGRVKDGRQKVNFSAELLRENTQGTLRLSVFALSSKEIALLLKACSVPWRLGGGKPLGLGLCSVKITRIFDEFGEEKKFENVDASLDPDIRQRFETWTATQQPVETMRYPRAVVRNNFKNTRGGLTWFQKFSTPKKKPNEDVGYVGMQPLMVCGELLTQVRDNGVNNSNYGNDAELIEGQMLPMFDSEQPEGDLLYGYDAFLCDKISSEELERFDAIVRQTVHFNQNDNTFAYPTIEQFDESKHITGTETSIGTTGQNRKNREEERNNRPR